MANRQAQKERLRRERAEQGELARRATERRRRLTQIGAAVVGLLVVAAAAVGLSTGGDDSARSTPGGTPPETESIADVHGLGVNPADKALYIATHHGLFRSAPGESSATRVDGPDQDLMGFSVAGPDRFVASGHPGPNMDAPGNLGFIESMDRGRTWKTLSLSGEADLHLLRASGDTAYAYDGTFRVSADGGRSWQEREAPDDLVDIAIDPADADHILASTGSGVSVSTDGGRTWQDTTLKKPVLLAWTERSRPFAIEGGGRVHSSSDGGSKWKAGGTYQGEPAAFAADASRTMYVAQGDGSVDASVDGGRTWQPRSRN